jgi:Cofilin/tropomyosin-type actin-binding protein
VNWILYTYSGGNSNTVVLKGKGSGGVDELLEQLDDSTVGYGLVRLIERVDESDTVKFAYINWTGDNIPRMLRARLGTHSGAIKEFLSVRRVWCGMCGMLYVWYVWYVVCVVCVVCCMCGMCYVVCYV